MNCDELQQLAALEALGALDPAASGRLRERVGQDPAAEADLRRFLEVSAALGCSVAPQRPSRTVRERVLAQIRRTPQKPAGIDPVPSLPEVPGIKFISADAPWQPAPLPGARFKLLSGGPGQPYVMIMIELAPGAGYPEHDHDGYEEMYVLSGDLQSEGRSLGPGDFLHAEPGSHHHELRSIEGCTAIMVVPASALAMLSAGQG